MIICVCGYVYLAACPTCAFSFTPTRIRARTTAHTCVRVLASECVRADGKEITGQERASYTFTDTLMDTLRESSMDP